MVPLTLPMISACWPLTSPSTTPLAPMITLAEQMMLPTKVPSIRKSPLLVISPFMEVPLPIRLALPEGTVLSVSSDLDLLLNIGIRFLQGWENANRRSSRSSVFSKLSCPSLPNYSPLTHYANSENTAPGLSLIHISEPTRQA